MQGGYQRSGRASTHESASRDPDVQFMRKSASAERKTSSTLFTQRGRAEPGIDATACPWRSASDPGVRAHSVSRIQFSML
jgi:hypothetical protein